MTLALDSSKHAGRTGFRWPASGLGRIHLATGAMGALVLLVAVAYVFAPLLAHRDTLGSGDWDQAATNRLLVTKTIWQFSQFPFWNPYSCGGHPAWGGPESDTIIVSPWLPAYLFLPLPLALRIEVLGSTLIGAAGAWLLASRFTRSRGLRLLVSVLFALNSRATLQLAVGHMWHSTYAYLPWALYFYDRAVGVDPLLGVPRRSDVVLTSVFLALLVYAGGIYPLPHTAVALGGYALLLAVATRSLVPLRKVMACGLLGAALGAPKLLPLAEVMRRFPRLIDSPESMDFIGFFAMLTSRDQDISSTPVPVSAWAWHEWGMYIGWPCVAAILVGLIATRGVRERALRNVGGVFVALAFGAFCEYAPWTILHQLPVFSSQHVPSRWLMPALLLLVCVAASAGERFLSWVGRWRGLAEIAVLLVVTFVVRDVCQVARTPLKKALTLRAPEAADSIGEFKTLKHVPSSLDYDAGGYSASSMSALVANVGAIDCVTFAAFANVDVRSKGRSPGLGARGVGDAEYRGEAYLPEGRGTARVVRFTPNDVVVKVDGARAGDPVVLNQNWDPGWRASGQEATSWHDAVASVVPSRSATVRFRYRPRMLPLGLLVFVATVSWLAAPWIAIAYGRCRPLVRRWGPLLRELRRRLLRRAPPPP